MKMSHVKLVDNCKYDASSLRDKQIQVAPVERLNGLEAPSGPPFPAINLQVQLPVEE